MRREPSDREQLISEQLMSAALQLHGTLSLIADEPIAVYVRRAVDCLDRSLQVLRHTVVDRQVGPDG